MKAAGQSTLLAAACAGLLAGAGCGERGAAPVLGDPGRMSPGKAFVPAPRLGKAPRDLPTSEFIRFEPPAPAGGGKPSRSPGAIPYDKKPRSIRRAVEAGLIEGVSKRGESKVEQPGVKFVKPAPLPRFTGGSPEERRAAVLNGLGSPSAAVRMLAAEQAAAMRLREAVPLLAGMALAGGATAPSAAYALGRIGGEEAVSALAKAVSRAEGPALRVDLVGALGLTGEPSAARFVMKALKDRSAGVRRGAARALGRIGRSGPEGEVKRIAAALMRALKDESALVRADAATALGELGGRVPEKTRRALITSLGAEELPVVRVAIAAGLARMGEKEGLLVLERAALQGSPALQVIAIGGLAAAASEGRLPERERIRAAEAVALALRSPYEEAWTSALAALRFLQPGDVLTVLESLRERAGVEVKGRAKLALALLRGKGARAELEDVLLTGGIAARRTACRLLGAAREPAAAGALARALSDPSRTVRIKAARALGGIGGEEAVSALRRARASEDPALRVVAAEALAALGELHGELHDAGRAERPAGAASAGKRSPFTLEKVLRSASGEPLCLVKGPDGRPRLLKKGEAVAEGFVIHQIVPGRDGKGKVFLIGPGGKTLTLKAE